MNALRWMTAAATALATIPVPALAEDVSELAGLLNEPVVSTASRSAETADLAPATTSVITADELRRHGVTSLHEAINFLALGMITEPSYCTPEIGARGVLLSGDFGNHVLLLLDGHALNEPWDGTAYYDTSAGIPLDLVDHIEIILGPGSVLYGSNAMLGVINVITKRAKDYRGVHLVAEGAQPTAAHLAGGYGKDFEWLGSEGELTLGLDYSLYRGPSMTYRPQPFGDGTWGGEATHRSTGVPAGYLRLTWGDLQISAHAAQSERSATQNWGNFDDPNNWQRDRWLSLDARWGASLSPNVRLSLRLYGDLYDYLENDPDSVAGDCLEGQSSCVYRNSGVSRWAGGEASTSWDWLGDARFVTLLGVDTRYRRVTSWTGYDDPTTGASTIISPYDKSGWLLGGYLQQTLRPVTWLSVNAGLRLDHDPLLGSHLSPRVAAVVPAWSGGTLKAIYSEAFRAPSFYERYYTDVTAWIAAPGLRPETVRSVEGAIEQRIGADRLRLGVFRTWWNDIVLRVSATPEQIAAAQATGELAPGVTQAFTYGNASRVDSYGLNADLNGTRAGQRLQYGAGITLAHSRQDQAPLSAAAQVFGNARISYDLGRRLPVLALALRAAGPRPVSGTSFTPVPEARPQVETRATVSGPLSSALSYRLSASWALSDAAAYGVGPVRDPQPGVTSQALLPLPRYQFWAGLRFDR